MSSKTSENDLKPASDIVAEKSQIFSRLKTARTDWESLSNSDKILGSIRALGVLILILIPVFLLAVSNPRNVENPTSLPNWLFVEWPGGRAVWTVVIALLPLFIVCVGFYTWRKICPLAFFGRLSEWLEWPDSRATSNSKLRRVRVSNRIAQNYPYITWGFLTLMLAARILLINSNPVALAAVFVGLCALAAAVSFRYTGKSWCNYFCPVGTIEKIYTDGDRPNYRQNSQCPKCTGCKTVPSGGLCPDINQENDYWQEIKSPSRTWVYYAWPGTVLGFYLWYFLHKPYYWHDLNRMGILSMRGRSIEVPNDGGTDWGFYLSGDWTRNPRPWDEWLTPGFGFHGLPSFVSAIPTLIAAPLTLAVLSILSYAIFKTMEFIGKRWRVRRGDTPEEALEAVRHPLFVIAGFTAFLCFYQFAGAPTFRNLPYNLYGTFQFGVAIFATMTMATRLRRTRTRQLQNDQARKWLKSWPLPGKKPPSDLEEAHRTVTEHLRSTEDRARIYQMTIVNLITDGVLTSAELSLLERLETDLDLSEIDKKRVMKQLSQQFPGKFQGSLHDSLRLLGYRGELETAIKEARGGLPTEERLLELQERYRIKPAIHDEILKELRNPDGARIEYLRELAERLLALKKDIAILEASPLPAARFLKHELDRLRSEELEHLLEVAGLFGKRGELTTLVPGVTADDSRSKIEAVAWFANNLPDSISGIVVEAACHSSEKRTNIDVNLLTRTLLFWCNETEIYLKAPALHALVVARSADPDLRERAHEVLTSSLGSSEALIRQAAIESLAPSLSLDQWLKALKDEVPEARLTALLELPDSVATSVREEVERLSEDSEESIREAANEILNRTNGSFRGTTLTALKKMFALRSIKLLSSLSATILHRLAERTKEDSFSPGETLFNEGQLGDSVYLLLEGETEAVQTLNGVERRLGGHHVGECVGEMAILDPGPRMASVRAMAKPVRALVVGGEDFRSLMRQDSNVSMNVIKLLIQRERKRG